MILQVSDLIESDNKDKTLLLPITHFTSADDPIADFIKRYKFEDKEFEKNFIDACKVLSNLTLKQRRNLRKKQRKNKLIRLLK
jgi:hypothetical protein